MLYSGLWVWVDRREKTQRGHRELVAVSYIRGENVVGFYALDGEEGSWPEASVRLVADNFLSLSTLWQPFRFSGAQLLTFGAAP